ncbi:hypothetical protein SNA02_01145, partial [Escherichia coli]|nr:hypothetical protein [Escherichia coli]MDZ9192190.1 hypothetical protein [Escherichia coli]
GTADRNRSHWSTSKTPSYTKSVSWQHHQEVKGDYSHYRTFLFDIGNQYKVKLTQSGKKSSL